MIPLSHGLSLSIILFILGLIGIMLRRNFLFILLGLEVMINAAAFMFVLAGSYLGEEDGQIMYILIVTAAASESVISLALLLRLYRYSNKLILDKISEMNG